MVRFARGARSMRLGQALLVLFQVPAPRASLRWRRPRHLSWRGRRDRARAALLAGPSTSAIDRGHRIVVILPQRPQWAVILRKDRAGFMGSRIRATMAAFVLGAVLLGSGVASAESAADRATARQLATEGIQLFQQGKTPEALDKLERAQELFEAPIHLIYIARCQVKLNRFVEAAENYRKLVRTELAANAPQAFKDAVAEGRDELAELEPRIPALRIEITPQGVEGMTIKIDSQSVSAAVLGIDRPINPGFHVVEVVAPNYAAYSKSVEVKPGAKDVLPVALVSQPGANVSGDKDKANKDAKDGGSDKAGGEGAAKTQDYSPRLAIVIGLRGNGSLPGGNIDKNKSARDSRSMSDRYGLGGGGEGQLGLAIPVGGFLVTPFVGFEMDFYTAGPYYGRPTSELFAIGQSSAVEYFATTNSQVLRVGGRFSVLPTHAYGFGFFGEVDAIPMQVFRTDGKLTSSNAQCNLDEEFSGMAIGLGAGALFALAPAFQLNARVGFSAGQFTSATRTLSGQCTESEGGMPGNIPAEPSGDVTKRDTHTTLTFGLGAEYAIGL
jgi:hypothetical protein